MGRTLHFSVSNAEQITELEKEKMAEISERMNSGEFKWTCENFYLDPYDYYPNWEYWKKEFPELSTDKTWESVRKSLDLIKLVHSRADAIKQLKAAGKINYHNEDEIRGFCKVGGNEWNAELVLLALLQISRETKAVIKLSDEGEFLRCPIEIKNGLARPNAPEARENLKYWEDKRLLTDNPNAFWNKDDQKRLAETVEFYKKILNDSTFRDPSEFCRPVNREDFESHPEYGAGQIMAGFSGEYFGLNGRQDAEQQSYTIAAQLQKMFQGAEMKVAEKI